MTDLAGNKDRSHRRVLLAGMFLLAFITIVDRVCISSAKYTIASELRVSDLQFGWVFGAFTLGYAAFMVPGGWCADRFGPRAVLTTIVCCWSLLTMGTGSVATLTQLIAIRFLFGMAEAGAYPAASRAIYSSIPASGRGLALGLLNAGSRLGAALGLPIATYTILWFGWRTCFRVLGSLGLVWALWWHWWYGEPSVAQEEEWVTRKGAYDRRAESSLGSGWTPLLFSFSGILLLLQYFANNFSYFLIYSWMLPYLEGQFNITHSRAAVYSGLPMYAGLVSTCAGGIIVDRLFNAGRGYSSRAIPAIAGFLLASAGMLQAGSSHSPKWFILGFTAVILGLDLTVSSSWALAVDLGKQHAGVLSGAMNMAGAMGSFTCSLAFPYIIGLPGHSKRFFELASLLNAAGALAWFFLSMLSRSPDR